MSDVYGNDIPPVLRLLGCFAIQNDRSGPLLRFSWGELSFTWGLALGYSVYHDAAHFHLQIGPFNLFVKAPMLITQRKGTEDWDANYGFSYFERALQLRWRTHCKIIHMPWDWQHVRHSFLNPDGSLHHHASGFEETPAETKEQHPYTYRRTNGEIQNRAATINGEEREWRWRWFTWLPWPRSVSRSINIDFDAEVGEQTGSWKGGTVGCGYEWRHSETMLEALRRMESERKF